MKVEPSLQSSWGVSLKMWHVLFIRRATKGAGKLSAAFPKASGEGCWATTRAPLLFIPRGAAEWLLAAIPALVLPNSSSPFQEQALVRNPWLPLGPWKFHVGLQNLPPCNSIPSLFQYPPISSASGSQAVTHSLHFLQSRLFPFWTNF